MKGRIACGPHSDWQGALTRYLGGLDYRFSALRARRVIEALRDGPSSAEELARALCGGQNMSLRTPYLQTIQHLLDRGLLRERPAFCGRPSRYAKTSPQVWVELANTEDRP